MKALLCLVRKALLISLPFFFSYQYSQATHNLGGQIYLIQDSGFTYNLMLTTYTDPLPAGVDRCAASLEIWDMSGASPVQVDLIQDIPKSNGPLYTLIPTDCPIQMITDIHEGEKLIGPLRKNVYDSLYTFPGPGTYEVRYYDIARGSNVQNINSGEESVFYVSSTIVVGNNSNQPPVFLNEGCFDHACLNSVWTHNPGGYDANGDQLKYRLRPAYEYYPGTINTPTPVASYLYPNDSIFGVSNLTIDSLTGMIRWDSPQMEGDYIVVYEVESYRNGQLNARIIRELIIRVSDCQNDPPEIMGPTDSIIQIDSPYTFQFKIYDPNPGDSLTLVLNNGGFGFNGPFSESVLNQATVQGYKENVFGMQWPFSSLPYSLENPIPVDPDTIHLEITWQADSSNYGQVFQVDLVAWDNLGKSEINTPGSITLTGHHVLRIQVGETLTSLSPQVHPGFWSLSQNTDRSIYYLQASDHPNQPWHYQVLDLQGRLIHQGQGFGQATSEINAQNWARGLYMIRVESAVGQQTLKLIR